jgi:hypothetical protein
VALALVGVGASSTAALQEVAGSASEPEEQIEDRTIAGEIAAVNKRFLSVEFSRTKTAAEEMAFSLDEKVTVEGAKKLGQLQPGDRVSVQYRQTYREGDEGQRVILKTVARKIVLLRTATPEGTLTSSEEVRTP